MTDDIGTPSSNAPGKGEIDVDIPQATLRRWLPISLIG
jgi:hypothetical protein